MSWTLSWGSGSNRLIPVYKTGSLTFSESPAYWFELPLRVELSSTIYETVTSPNMLWELLLFHFMAKFPFLSLSSVFGVRTRLVILMRDNSFPLSHAMVVVKVGFEPT